MARRAEAAICARSGQVVEALAVLVAGDLAADVPLGQDRPGSIDARVAMRLAAAKREPARDLLWIRMVRRDIR
jgi:hypothetical protein